MCLPSSQIYDKSLCEGGVLVFCFAGLLHLFPSRIGMARMDTVDLSSGSEVYTPDVEEVSLIVSNHLLEPTSNKI